MRAVFYLIFINSLCFASTLKIPLYYHKLRNLKDSHIVLNGDLFSLLGYTRITIAFDQNSSSPNKLKTIKNHLDKTDWGYKGNFRVMIVKKTNERWQKVKNPTPEDFVFVQHNDSYRLMAIFTPWDPYNSYFW